MPSSISSAITISQGPQHYLCSTTVSFLRDGEALEYGYYPAERDITIPITGLEIPGVYYLEIGATLKGGGVTTVELWFYHLGA